MTDPLIEQIKADAEKVWNALHLGKVCALGLHQSTRHIEASRESYQFTEAEINAAMELLHQMEARILADAEEKAALKAKVELLEKALLKIDAASDKVIWGEDHENAQFREDVEAITDTTLISIGDSDE